MTLERAKDAFWIQAAAEKDTEAMIRIAKSYMGADLQATNGRKANAHFLGLLKIQCANRHTAWLWRCVRCKGSQGYMLLRKLPSDIRSFFLRLLLDKGTGIWNFRDSKSIEANNQESVVVESRSPKWTLRRSQSENIFSNEGAVARWDQRDYGWLVWI